MREGEKARKEREKRRDREEDANLRLSHSLSAAAFDRRFPPSPSLSLSLSVTSQASLLLHHLSHAYADTAFRDRKDENPLSPSSLTKKTTHSGLLVAARDDVARQDCEKRGVKHSFPSGVRAVVTGKANMERVTPDSGDTRRRRQQRILG